MLVHADEIIRWISLWIWPFFRIAGLMMSAPIVGTRSIPVRVRLSIAIAVTIVIAPVIPEVELIDPLSIQGLLTSMQQVFIGIAMGLCIRVVFVVLELAGQLLGQLMGLMLASMVDPQNGSQLPIIGQFYLLLATLLFLSIDGHLIMIHALAMSFHELPVGTSGISRDALWEFLMWVNAVIAAAVLISMPAIASMLIVNLAFGVMTRSAPQLNIFAVGFPFMIIVGVIVIYLSLDTFIPHMQSLFDDAFRMLHKILVL